jgi:peptidyl-prolyl cis-trans isomerase C
VLLAALLTVPASCSLSDETAVVVNGRKIETAELERAYEKFLSQFGEVVPTGAAEATRTRKALLDRLVDRELMMEVVEKQSLRPDEAAVAREAERLRGDLTDHEFETILADAGLGTEQWRKQVFRDLSLEKLQQEAVFSSLEVPEEEIDEYLRGHSEDYELSEEVRASQILVRTREEALQAAKRIRGGVPFADVAREASLSPDGEGGGDLGYFARGQMPQEFDAVVFSLPVGKLSPVVETTYGHHLFLVTDRREARRKSEEEIRQELRRMLLTGKKEQAFGAWMTSLREKADIRYNEKVISP